MRLCEGCQSCVGGILHLLDETLNLLSGGLVNRRRSGREVFGSSEQPKNVHLAPAASSLHGFAGESCTNVAVGDHDPNFQIARRVPGGASR